MNNSTKARRIGGKGTPRLPPKKTTASLSSESKISQLISSQKKGTSTVDVQAAFLTQPEGTFVIDKPTVTAFLGSNKHVPVGFLIKGEKKRVEMKAGMGDVPEDFEKSAAELGDLSSEEIDKRVEKIMREEKAILGSELLEKAEMFKNADISSSDNRDNDESIESDIKKVLEKEQENFTNSISDLTSLNERDINTLKKDTKISSNIEDSTFTITAENTDEEYQGKEEKYGKEVRDYTGDEEYLMRVEKGRRDFEKLGREVVVEGEVGKVTEIDDKETIKKKIRENFGEEWSETGSNGCKKDEKKE